MDGSGDGADPVACMPLVAAWTEAAMNWQGKECWTRRNTKSELTR